MVENALSEIKEILERPIDVRRMELLTQRALGVPLRDIVEDLARKHKVAEKTIYSDWRIRKKWGPKLLEIDDGDNATLSIHTLLEWLKRRSVTEVLQGDNSAARIGAIKTAESIAMDLYDIFKDTGKIQTVQQNQGVAKVKLEMVGLGKRVSPTP